MSDTENDGSAAADPAATSESSSPTPAQSTPTTEPSSAPTGETPSKQTLLDSVLQVVPATTERDVLAKAEDTSTPQDDKTPEETDQAETDHETETEVADDEAPPGDPKLRKKFNRLLKERRELRHEVEVLKAPAEIGGELRQFAEQNDLSGDDVANTLKIAALLRSGDYESFYRAIAPFVRTAQEYLGVVLPRDLSERVRAGHMTEPAAREFARQRYDHQRSQFELQQTTEASSRQRVQSTQAEVQRAVSSFELRLSANDPDYKAKAPSVRRTVQALLHERGGTIRSVDEALAITRSAYDEVNRQMKTYQPRPTPTRPQPNGATQTSSSARAAPKTLMEAAIQGLETARRAGG